MRKYYRSADALTLAFDEYQRGNVETATKLVGEVFSEADFPELLRALGQHNAQAEIAIASQYASQQDEQFFESASAYDSDWLGVVAGDFATIESNGVSPDVSPWALSREAPHEESSFLRRFRANRRRKELIRQQHNPQDHE